MTGEILPNFILIVGSLLLGALLRWSDRLPHSTPNLLNKYVIWVALPAAILVHIPFVKLSAADLLPALMPWMLFIIGAVCLIAVNRITQFKANVLGALILTATLGNTSFVGFPLLEAFYGREALATGIIIDQAGSFLVVATLGIMTASIYSSRSTSVFEIGKRILTFPPFIVMIVALLLRNVDSWDVALGHLSWIAWTLAPAALISVGYQLRMQRALMRSHAFALMIGLSYKLVLGPAIVALIYLFVLRTEDHVTLITITEAAMPPMITAAIIASQYGLDSELTSLMVGIGIPLSLLTIPLWVAVLRAVV